MSLCKFKKRFQPFSYVLPLFISIWVFITIYLAFYKTSHTPPRLMAPIEDSTFAAKLADLENVVGKQLEENRRLLNEIKGRPDVGPGETTPDHLSARIAVLVISCNRAEAVKNLLDQLLRLRPSKEQFPVIVSLDCAHQETQSAVESYGNQIVSIRHPDQSEIITLPPKHKKFASYYKLARHYKWTLNKTFYDFGHESVIIVEDDLDIAVDFFEYFLAGNRLLSLDPTLWCVSAWNDHGKPELIDVKEPELLYRTDFFGGLGWLLQKRVWNELHHSWPATFWDDWMRHPDQRKHRACIRPEIPRTSMSYHGKVGVSRGLYFDKHLKFIKRNDVRVNFTRLDLSYLLKDNYDEPFVRMVYNTPVWSLEKLDEAYSNGQAPKTVRFTYTDQKNYVAWAKNLKIMEDAKAGVGRMAYRGVVTFIYKQTRVFLAPPAGWTNYDTRWT